MTKEDEVYYENYFEMFASKGWKQLIKETKNEIDLFTIDNIPDEQTLKHIQGQLRILRNLTNLEDAVKNNYDTFKAEELVNAS